MGLIERHWRQRSYLADLGCMCKWGVIAVVEVDVIAIAHRCLVAMIEKLHRRRDCTDGR